MQGEYYKRLVNTNGWLGERLMGEVRDRRSEKLFYKVMVDIDRCILEGVGDFDDLIELYGILAMRAFKPKPEYKGQVEKILKIREVKRRGRGGA